MPLVTEGQSHFSGLALCLLYRKYRQQEGKEKHPSVIKWVKQNGIDCILNHEASASEELKC